MANIPGISGYLQPGVYARDRVISRSVSIPGGVRLLSILGEGSREVTLVESASGSGLDGSIDLSGDTNGRLFQVPMYPMISGRTELRLNNSLLFGKQEAISGSLDSKYDYRLDISTGEIELRGASFKDIDGKAFKANASNVGLGTIKELILMDENTEAESYTLRNANVRKDNTGNPIPGTSKFVLVGSKSGTSRNPNGNAISFTDTYKVDTAAVIKANTAITQGLVIGGTTANGLFTTSTFTASAATLVDSDGTPIALGPTLHVKVLDNVGPSGIITDDESLFSKSIVGDSFVFGTEEYIIEAMTYTAYVGSVQGFTTLELSRSIDYADTNSGTISSWDVRAFNAITLSISTLNGSDVGKLASVSSGVAEGYYTVTHVQTADNIIRVASYTDSTASFPTMVSDDASVLVSLLETNGVIAVGIEEHSSSGFQVGDKFTFETDSLVLSENDKLDVSFIYQPDVNDPAFFLSSSDLIEKHGYPSIDNNLSLGAQIAFENGAPGVLALQTKPALPRRTEVVLLPEVNSIGVGGYSGSDTVPEADDLTFEIPVPASSGIRSGRPDSNTQVNIFAIRDGKDIQIFPNKDNFYNSQYDDDTGRATFVAHTVQNYSYTIANYGNEIFASEEDGVLTKTSGNPAQATFYSPGSNFDANSVGKTIVIKSGVDSSLAELSLSTDIGVELFSSNETHELTVVSVQDDQTLIVKNLLDGTEHFNNNLTLIQFLLKGSETNNDTAALLIHKDLVTSEAILPGDGIKITYIDENDADFYDLNFFEAFQRLEAFDAQIIVPLPKQNKSAVFQAAVRHCELMSSITKRRERLALIGAFQGITPDALVGRSLIAVEDIGVVEGIQGDDPEEILNENIEDLQNYKLSDNFTSNRSVYFYPDQIVRAINGTNTYLDGFYMAAAAGGYLSGTTNIVLPLTNKVLNGFTILRNKVYRDINLNELGGVGATVVQPVTGGGRVLAGRTTSITGFAEDEEISIMFIRDQIKQSLIRGMKPFVGKVQTDETRVAAAVVARQVMTSMINNIIESHGPVIIQVDKVDRRQLNVLVSAVPLYPINNVFIDIAIGLQ